MLSRASIHSLQKPMCFLLGRAASTTPAVKTAVSTATATTPCVAADATPADNNLWIRPVRPELPGAVRLGFIPEEWFTFFYKKTGVSGPYTFAITLGTYLVSKELYVLEHEYYAGLSFAILLTYGIKKFGPDFKKAADDEVDAILAGYNQSRVEQIEYLEEAIEAEKKEQWRADGQMLLNDAQKENVALQLEAAYRARLANVYSEVKRRLDYQVEIQLVDRRIKQQHLVKWVREKVLASITPDQDKETLSKCIADLSSLAKA